MKRIAVPVQTYIALGSNLGNRMNYLCRALQHLSALGIVTQRSPVYETPPVGYENQGPFLNAVVVLETELPPDTLLRELKTIEQKLGRRPVIRNGPRVIDLDILLYGNERRTDEPTLPHPRMHERAFVLRPLLDIASDLTLPGIGSAADCWNGLTDKRLELWEQSLDAC